VETLSPAEAGLKALKRHAVLGPPNLAHHLESSKGPAVLGSRGFSIPHAPVVYSAPMNLRDMISPESVVVFLEEGSKEHLIEQLVDVLPVDPDVPRGVILGNVLERERTMSTGIGRGVAIPHGKAEGIHGILASVGLTRNPVPFDAIDGLPVKVFFLVVSDPRTTNPHVRVLSQISRILNDEKRKTALMDATSAQDVLAALDLEGE
jgi:mannitol/fructose-specific phosphotransferase system IIA component (Ntr-type)